MNSQGQHPVRRRGATLVELLVALTVLAIISTAVTTLLSGAAETSSYVNTATDTVSQVETAYRRMVHNLRTASAISAPADTNAHTSGTLLTIQTQPDPSYGNAACTVSYLISGNNLVEQDTTRYGTNTLVYNATVSVKRLSMTSPTLVQVTISAGGNPTISRTFTVYCRNL